VEQYASALTYACMYTHTHTHAYTNVTLNPISIKHTYTYVYTRVMLSGLALERPDLDNAVGSIVRQVFLCIHVLFSLCIHGCFPVYTRFFPYIYTVFPCVYVHVQTQTIMCISVQPQWYCF
jgi:hypothetical protein